MKARWAVVCVAALMLAACGRPSALPPAVVLAHVALGHDAWRAGLGPGGSLVVQRSTDSGGRWSAAKASLPSGVGRVEAVHLAFPTTSDGWLLVRGQSLCVLMRTGDGGSTWAVQPQVTQPLCQAAAVAFRTPEQGWVVMAYGAGLGVYRTTDGGQTWTRSHAPLPEGGGRSIEAIDGLAFTDARRGAFQVSFNGSPSGVLSYATQDGGATWYVTTPTPAMAEVRLGGDVWQVDAPLDQEPLTLPIRRSTDGGRAWTTAHVRLPRTMGDAVWADAVFVDPAHGWVLVSSGPATAQAMWALLHTTDGGQTWSVAARTGAGTFLGLAYDSVAMSFRTPSQGWIAAVDQWPTPMAVDVFRTVDGGLHWQRTLAPLPTAAAAGIRPPAFTSASRGALTVTLKSGTLTYVTTDGGATWTLDVAACTAAVLSAHGGRQGENTGAHGDVLFTNTGSQPCLLDGLPAALRLVRADGSALATRTLPAEGPVAPLLLEPGGTGWMVVYWSNWCGPQPGALRLRITLPAGRGTVTAPFDGPPDYDYVPACLSASQPSTLRVVSAYSASG